MEIENDGFQRNTYVCFENLDIDDEKLRRLIKRLFAARILEMDFAVRADG